jgi:hypothetical protein
MKRKRVSKSIVAIGLALVTIAAALLAASVLRYRRVAVSLPESDRQAIRQEFDRLREPANRRLADYNQRDEIIAVELEGEWATVEFGAVYLDTGEPVPAGPGLMIFKKIDGRWQGAQSGTDAYKTWLDQIPDTLISPGTKDYLR